MSTPKKHHYIPQNHIKRFYGSNGKLWYFDKRTVSRGVVEEVALNIFFVKHHNTIVHQTGARDTQIETELAKLEGLFKSTVDQLIENIDTVNPMDFSEGTRTFIHDYAFLQWRRSPDFENQETDLTTPQSVGVLKRVFEKQNGVVLSDQQVSVLAEFNSGKRPLDQEVVDVMNQLSDDGEPSVSLEDMQTHYDSEQNNRVKRNAIISARYENLPDGNPLNSGKLWICRLSDGLSFLLGSNPVFAVSVARESYTHALCGIVLPISSNVAFVFGRKDYPFRNEEITDPTIVRTVNQGIAAQSVAIGGARKALISSFAKPIIKAHKRNKPLSEH